MKITELENKNILILGLGREGRDTFRFLRRLFPKKILVVADKLEFEKLDKKSQKLIQREKRSRRVKLYLGKNNLKALKNYDVIIKSPGIPPKVIAPFVQKKQKIASQTEIFLENCPGKIIGVTGTKGKGTTSSLIYKILKEGGLKVHLVGNIGKPVLNMLFSARPKDIYVYEMSSHQLYNLKKSPPIAVFLNISQAHLDYFKNFNDYIKAKSNITKYQKKEDFLIYNSKDRIVKEIAKKSKARKIPIPTNYQSFADTKIPLIGKFNRLNILAAIEVGKLFGVQKRKILKAIREFKPLPHRLEPVGKYQGIKFYNDSAATVPDATCQAISALGKDIQTIILGGYENNVDYKNLAKRILNSKIKNVILFPPSGKRIWQEITKICGGQTSTKLPRYFFVNNMGEAVKLAYQQTKKNKICLLSCASPSFGIFKDYKQRGNFFKNFVKEYGSQ